MSNQKDRCQLCSDTKSIRYLGRDNSEIVEDCPDCAGTGPSTARAGVTCTALVGAVSVESELPERDIHAQLEEAVNEAQYSYVIGDKASEGRWLERAAAMIRRRIHVIGKESVEPIAPTMQITKPHENSEK